MYQDELQTLVLMRSGVEENGALPVETRAVSTSEAQSFSTEAKGTRRLYLEDTFLYQTEAVVVTATETELILDRTIVHPQGGGQPNDADGKAVTADGNVFSIHAAKASSRGPDAVITHSGTWKGVPAQPGTRIMLTINGERRHEYARIHTGGHVIDLAMARAGYTHLSPLKGYHFPDGAYVEYDGTVDDTQALVQQLNKQLADIIAADLPIIVSSPSQASERKEDINTDRVVSIAGEQACACGGTHLTSTKQLGAISVTKAKHKSKKLKVSYNIHASTD